MLYFAGKLLNEEEHRNLRKRLLMSPDWIDGKHSAHGKAKEIKKNVELNLGESYETFSEEIKKEINKNKFINNFAYPSKIFSLLFTRTGVGMYYGPHVDCPYLPEGRRDFSFTIFLNEPSEYKGGELILNIPPERKAIKMNAGEIIIYPTKYLHEVKEVTEGERMVCVGWIESQIARDDDRESLSMFQKGIGEVIENHGQSKTTDILNIAYNNIYKRFMS